MYIIQSYQSSLFECSVHVSDGVFGSFFNFAKPSSPVTLRQMVSQQRRTDEFVSGLVEKLNAHQQLVRDFTEKQADELSVHVAKLRDITTSQNEYSQVCIVSTHGWGLELLLCIYSSSSYSHFYVGSMYDDVRLHVARSYTSSADSPFSLISSFTLSNHLLLGLPLFLLPCTFISIALLPT